ncbi:MAG TPA: hypothetical protein PK765_05080 [bacterium]|nr:hypothetical protein [bacterium]
MGLVGSAGASAILSQLTPAKESATVAYDRGSPSLGTAEILAAMEAGLPVR